MDTYLPNYVVLKIKELCDHYGCKVEFFEDQYAMLTRLKDLISPTMTTDEFIESWQAGLDLIWCAILPINTICITLKIYESMFDMFKSFLISSYFTPEDNVTDDIIFYISTLHEIAHLIHPEWEFDDNKELYCNNWAVNEYKFLTTIFK